MELQGQAALVTGGSRGIGKAIALSLAAGGARVAITYRERRDEAEATLAAMHEVGAEAVAIQADLTDAAACQRVVQESIDHFGTLQVLVHNAGTALERLLIDTELGEWDQLMALHLRALYACTRAALQPMMSQRYGRILVISSIWGAVGAAGEVAYSTAKAGQNGFVKALAQEVGAMGITVNAIAPGAIRTEMTAHLLGDELQEWLAKTPVGRLGEPEEVAALARFLTGPNAGFMTGQVISPNGGVVT
jgi:3-oxoacyl-[acyl-carrier protein] reductase